MLVFVFVDTLLIVYWLYNENVQYPAFGDAKEFSLHWMWPIILRNDAVFWTLGTSVLLKLRHVEIGPILFCKITEILK